MWWCLLWCMLSAFRCHAACHIHLLGLNHWDLHHLQPLGAYPWQAYVQPGNGHQSASGMHQVASPSTALSRGSLLLLHQLSSIHSNYMMRHAALRAWQSHLIPPAYLHGGKVSCVHGCSHPMAQLTLNLQWALNLVVLVW